MRNVARITSDGQRQSETKKFVSDVFVSRQFVADSFVASGVRPALISFFFPINCSMSILLYCSIKTKENKLYMKYCLVVLFYLDLSATAAEFLFLEKRYRCGLTEYARVGLPVS